MTDFFFYDGLKNKRFFSDERDKQLLLNTANIIQPLYIRVIICSLLGRYYQPYGNGRSTENL